jgi:hypothetical protein
MTNGGYMGFLLLVLSCALSSAQAHEGAGRGEAETVSAVNAPSGRVLQLYAGGRLGLGGHKTETEDYRERNMKATPGAQAGLEWLLPYSSVGAEVRVGAFLDEAEAEHNDERTLLIDIDFKPRIRYPLSRKSLEFYLALPIGPSFNRISRRKRDRYEASGDRISADVGFNLSPELGFTYFSKHRLGVSTGVAYSFYWYALDAVNDDMIFRAEHQIRQVTLFINLLWAL